VATLNAPNAELVGLSLGMHLIKTEKAACCHTSLGADNQAAINLLQDELSVPEHYLVKDILQTAQQIRKQRDDKNYKLTIRWTAEHIGIDGNKLVDAEAKKAAKGQSSNPSSLLCILHQKLKISATALETKPKQMSWEKMEEELEILCKGKTRPSNRWQITIKALSETN